MDTLSEMGMAKYHLLFLYKTECYNFKLMFMFNSIATSLRHHREIEKVIILRYDTPSAINQYGEYNALFTTTNHYKNGSYLSAVDSAMPGLLLD
jgi:hypothetical protein